MPPTSTTANSTDKALIRALQLLAADPMTSLPFPMVLHNVIHTHRISEIRTLADLYAVKVIDDTHAALDEMPAPRDSLALALLKGTTRASDHAYTLRAAAQGRRGPNPHSAAWTVTVHAVNLVSLTYHDASAFLAERIHEIATQITR
jgi:hypothetical protein